MFVFDHTASEPDLDYADKGPDERKVVPELHRL